MVRLTRRCEGGEGRFAPSMARRVVDGEEHCGVWECCAAMEKTSRSVCVRVCVRVRAWCLLLFEATRSRTNCSIGSSWTLKVDGVTDPLTTDREPGSLRSPPLCTRLAATVVAAPFILAPAAWPADPAVSCPIRLEFGTANTTKATTPIYQRVCLRVLSLLLGVWSAAVVWSEMTFFIRSPMVSLFGLFHRAAERQHDYLAIELMSVVTLGYLCVCAYYTVFRVRVLNYYYLAPHHLTDAYSLVFAGMLLCRLTPPLCLNFLGLLHLDTHVSSEAHRVETAYTEVTT
ncbi:hypothetical protein HPB49_008395 [Dermacentor silvarum]|uniref:Uncharacterized protein n=1 Tax=Dermacentor silvarum TaxID=543639 RepID=A0ACB8DNS2_DERSI|nr:hypothetical protein HPB49_008395 [Dermacentor silvarum]